MTSGKSADRAIGRMKRVASQRLLSMPIEDDGRWKLFVCKI